MPRRPAARPTANPPVNIPAKKAPPTHNQLKPPPGAPAPCPTAASAFSTVILAAVTFAANRSSSRRSSVIPALDGSGGGDPGASAAAATALFGVPSLSASPYMGRWRGGVHSGDGPADSSPSLKGPPSIEMEETALSYRCGGTLAAAYRQIRDE